MRILAFTPYYLPGFRAGGPIRSIANLVDALGDENEFFIVTSDHDLRDPHPYPSATDEGWQDVGRARVAYLPNDRRHTARLHALVHEASPQLVYLNSLFNFRFSLLPLTLRRLGLLPVSTVLLAPRGELAQNARSIKAWKKRPALSAARSAGLFQGVSWHATCEGEAQDIRRVFGEAAQVQIAPNLSARVQESRELRPEKRPGRLRLAFVARICPIKNLLWGIERLAEIGGPVSLDIWGPIGEQTYWRRCQKAIATLPSGVRVRHRGELPHEQVSQTIGEYDGMLLPTLNENFGHAAIESLAAGCPLVISDRTPWRNLVEQGVGWDLPLERPESFREALQELRSMDESRHRKMRSCARRYASRNAEGASAKMRRVLRDAA